MQAIGAAGGGELATAAAPACVVVLKRPRVRSLSYLSHFNPSLADHRPSGRPPKDPAKRAARLQAMLAEAAKTQPINLAGEVNASLVTTERKRRGRPPKHVKLVRLAPSQAVGGAPEIVAESAREARKKPSAASSSGDEPSSAVSRAERPSRRRPAPIEPVIRPKRARRAPKWAHGTESADEEVPTKAAPSDQSEDHVSDSEIEDLHADDDEDASEAGDADEYASVPSAPADVLLSLASFAGSLRDRAPPAIQLVDDAKLSPVPSMGVPSSTCSGSLLSSPSLVTRTMKRSDSWLKITLMAPHSIGAC